jgi:hypothetical protein
MTDTSQALPGGRYGVLLVYASLSGVGPFR